MKKYTVGYSEIYSGTIEIEADSEAEANDIICNMIDSGALDPSVTYDGHEVSVDFIE